MKKLILLNVAWLGAVLVIALPQCGHSQVPFSGYAWWEQKYGHLGKTTDEILGRADTEHPHAILSALNYRIRQKRDLRGERGLTAVERRLAVLFRLDVELNNLEFKGYLQSETANDMQAALDALKVIGATNTVAILQRATAVFPGGKPPSEAPKRREIAEQIAPRAKPVWESCVAEYYIDNKRLHALTVAYAKQKRAEIVLP